jgi:hypothetical protein
VEWRMFRCDETKEGMKEGSRETGDGTKLWMLGK